MLKSFLWIVLAGTALVLSMIGRVSDSHALQAPNNVARDPLQRWVGLWSDAGDVCVSIDAMGVTYQAYLITDRIQFRPDYLHAECLQLDGSYL